MDNFTAWFILLIALLSIFMVYSSVVGTYLSTILYGFYESLLLFFVPLLLLIFAVSVLDILFSSRSWFLMLKWLYGVSNAEVLISE